MTEVSGDKRFGHYPVGVLSNGKNTIEIFFLHYHSEQEASQRCERRGDSGKAEINKEPKKKRNAVWTN